MVWVAHDYPKPCFRSWATVEWGRLCLSQAGEDEAYRANEQVTRQDGGVYNGEAKSA